MENENRMQKVAIIGAGISGMTAGIYAVDNNFDVTIYEKHSVVGGECTGWVRENTYIDGCAHWIVGTNEKSDLYPLWKHIGAFPEGTVIHDTDYFCKYDINGETITLYSDLSKLEAELLRVAPEDKKKIKQVVNGIKAYRHVRIPVKKPLDKMNLLELTIFGIQMLPMFMKYISFKKKSVSKYAETFKSPVLKELFHRVLEGNYNIHSLFYILQTLSKNDAGVLEGGSIRLANNIRKKFLSMGGKIITNCEVQEVLVDDGVAKGIRLQDGTEVMYDYVIAACDINFTLTKLLNDKYTDSYYKTRFSNRTVYPLNTSMQVSFKVTKDVSSMPKMINFNIEPITLADTTVGFITLRNHSYDSSLNRNVTSLSVLIPVLSGVYDYFSELSDEEYIKAKNDFGMYILKEVEKYTGLTDQDISLIDVTTPLTYERYTNAYQGSYMSFISTDKSKGLMRPGTLKGLKHFVLSGQWLMPPGGLPIALFTGKHAVQRLCYELKLKFVDLD